MARRKDYPTNGTRAEKDRWEKEWLDDLRASLQRASDEAMERARSRILPVKPPAPMDRFKRAEDMLTVIEAAVQAVRTELAAVKAEFNELGNDNQSTTP